MSQRNHMQVQAILSEISAMVGSGKTQREMAVCHRAAGGRTALT